jgi:hypothetical protein
MRISKALFFFIILTLLNVRFIYALENVCPVININLTISSKNTDVEILQKFLISKGFEIPAITERNAKPGFFGEETKNALASYQKSININGTGFFGPLTREKIRNGCVIEVPTVTKTEDTDQESIIVTNTKGSYTLIDNKGKTPSKATFSFSFTISNNADKDVYIGSKPGNSLVALVESGTGSSSMTLLTADPIFENGDTSLSYVIPKNKGRSFVATGRVDNTNGKEGIQLIVIKEIPYSYDSNLSEIHSVILDKSRELKTQFKLGTGF